MEESKALIPYAEHVVSNSTETTKCDHIIERQFVDTIILPLRLSKLPEIDDIIYMRTDFVTAFICGASNYVLKTLLLRESNILRRISRFNLKCTHEKKWISIYSDTYYSADEVEEHGDLVPCCSRERDTRVLTHEEVYLLLRYLHSTDKFDITYHDIEGGQSTFDKSLCKAFNICACAYARLCHDKRTLTVSAFLRTYNVLRIMSGLGGLTYVQ